MIEIIHNYTTKVYDINQNKNMQKKFLDHEGMDTFLSLFDRRVNKEREKRIERENISFDSITL